MTPEAQRIAIAEACGWRRTMYQSPSQIPAGVPFWVQNGKFVQDQDLPDYINDLNAMHEAEGALKFKQQSDYCIQLQNLEDYYWSATAAKRAEAFLRTLGLWKEETTMKGQNV